MIKSVLVAAAATVALSAQAQTLPTTGTLVVVPAFGEVKHANDQVVATLAIEEQDKDKAAAASRVNQKMNKGLAIVKQADPSAVLKSYGYYTYPVYPEDRPLPAGAVAKPRVPTAWRVGQYLEVTTANLASLPKTVSAAQGVLTLNGLNFGLKPETIRLLDDQRIASIARAMGRNVSDAVLDTVDFEGSGNYAGESRAAAPAPMMMRSKMADDGQVAEPSFEPGETTLDMRLVGKVKFK